MGGDPRFAGTNHNDIELFVVTDSQNFVTHVAKDYAGMDPRHGDGEQSRHLAHFFLRLFFHIGFKLTNIRRKTAQ